MPSIDDLTAFMASTAGWILGPVGLFAMCPNNPKSGTFLVPLRSSSAANHPAALFETTEGSVPSFPFDTTAENDVRVNVDEATYDWLWKLRHGLNIGSPTTAKYLTEPNTPVSFTAGTELTPLKYVDVAASGFTNGKAVIIVSYTEAELQGSGVIEDQLTLHYCNGMSWVILENIGRDPANNKVWGEISLTSLTGTPIGVGGPSAAVGGHLFSIDNLLTGNLYNYWWIPVLLITTVSIALIIIRRR